MNDTITMNATASGLTGITNLASQSGTLGTIFGMTLLVGLLVGVFASAHSWNTKGWLYKLVKFLLKNVGENVLVGVASCSVVGGIYYVGSELSKFGDANPRFLYDVALFCGDAILAVAIFAVIGYTTKPIWNFAMDYASGKKRKVKA